MNPKLPKPPNFVQSTDCPFDDNTDMLELLNKFYQIVHPISKIDYILRKLLKTLGDKLED